MSSTSNTEEHFDYLRAHYEKKIRELEEMTRTRLQNLERLQAQRSELNHKVVALRQELDILQNTDTSFIIANVIKILDRDSVLVKIGETGTRLVVKVHHNVNINDIKPNTRVTLCQMEWIICKILPPAMDISVIAMMVEKAPDMTYDQIGGLDKQIREIKEVVELPLKHPELFDILGIEQPKGVLLYGPPGTGKTLLARAVARHSDCTFIRASGTELVQTYIGEGSRMIRELFQLAKKHSPSIVFLDEIDSLGAHRVANSDSEVQRTMLELLNQLDGFTPLSKVKVIMATNRIDILDPALLRPGRIDRKINFVAPKEQGIIDILRIHSRKMNLARNIDLKRVAEKVKGASGAELKSVCTEAGIFALRECRKHVTMEDFKMAAEKVMRKKTQRRDVSINMIWK